LIDYSDDYAIWNNNGEIHHCNLSSPEMEQFLERGWQLIWTVRGKDHKKRMAEYSPDDSQDWIMLIGDGCTGCCSMSGSGIERSIIFGERFVKIVRNMNYNEAAQAYYDTFNMGTYKPF
jgi:hypothetical protein